MAFHPIDSTANRPGLSGGAPSAKPATNRWSVGTLAYTTSGLVALFGWLLWGDFAWSMKERAVGPVVQLLLKDFEASDLLAGLLMGSLPAVIVMVLGPIVSYRSDRHRGRMGRRIPFLLFPTPVAALAMVGLAYSPQCGAALHELLGPHSLGLHPAVLIFFGLFWGIFEIATIIANSVYGGLINDVVPQRFLGRFYGLFRALSLAAGILFNFWLFAKVESHFSLMFLGIGVLYSGGFSLMCFKVKEGQYPPPPPAIPGVAGGFFGAARTYLRECFTHPYYLLAIATLAIISLAAMPVNLFSVFYAKSINMDMGVYGKLLALSYTVSLGLAYFLGWAADRFHPLRSGMVAVFLYAAAMFWAGTCIHDRLTFGIAFVAHVVLSGTVGTITASLGQRLFPASKFAQFVSAVGIIGSIATILFAPVVGRFLD